MPDYPVHVIDLQFQGVAEAIAVYVIPHSSGAVMIECGPASTLPALESGLAELGLSLPEITDLFVTHIHLDHAGAVGWIARKGARVHVHHVGAPHLVDPSKLLASAGRIYGDHMDRLWGEFLEVPADQVVPLYDGNEVIVEGVRITAVDTPGHANHHHAYVFDGLCFSGDVGGIRLPGREPIELPLPPPELDLGAWMDSVRRLQEADIEAIAPTHFGIYRGAKDHLARTLRALEEVEAWLQEAMADEPSQEVFQERYLAWLGERSRRQGDDSRRAHHLETVNPGFMSAQGLYRYWKKQRGLN